jgi:polysaccharide pyruvyl transferase WcaK-like protein
MGVTSGIEPKECDSMQKNICFFGAFGSPNFGNSITFETILHHLRCRMPDAQAACVCTGPEALEASQNIKTFSISPTFFKPGRLRTRFARRLRTIFIGVPSELWRWLDAFKKLKGTDKFIIPGTGLLTDAYGLSGWGPYSLFKWSLIAKLRGCQVFFVSVGAGPIYTTLGRCLIKLALSLADFRSYRDNASMVYLKGIGFPVNGDRVFPDLVFSLPESAMPGDDEKRASELVVGIGLMPYPGKYSAENPNDQTYREYLDNLVALAGWLLAHNYTIRLLVGDVCDSDESKAFKSLLKASIGAYDEESVVDEPALSVEQLLRQIAATDFVVATRFHNVVLALVLNKPVVAISFHQKCASLMSDMGLAEYCHDINHMNAGRLIEQFQGLERNADQLKHAVRLRVEQLRKALDEQYKVIFKSL